MSQQRRPARQRKTAVRYDDFAIADELQAVLQDLGPINGTQEAPDEDDEPAQELDSDDERAAEPKPKRVRVAKPPPRTEGPEMADLFVRALGVPDFAQQLVRPDPSPPLAPHGVVVRTLALAARDVASAAVALAVRAPEMAPAWRAMAEECLGAGVPENQAPAMYQACVRVAIQAARNPKLVEEVRKSRARWEFELTLEDLKHIPFSAARRGYYDLPRVQAAAHAKHGDAASIAALKLENELRTKARRDAQLERMKIAREARLAVVEASLRSAGLDPGLALGETFFVIIEYGGWDWKNVIAAKVAPLAAARAGRLEELQQRLAAESIPAEMASSELFVGWLQHGEPGLEVSLARCRRRRLLAKRLRTSGLRFDPDLPPAAAYIFDGGNLLAAVAAIAQLVAPGGDSSEGGGDSGSDNDEEGGSGGAGGTGAGPSGSGPSNA